MERRPKPPSYYPPRERDAPKLSTFAGKGERAAPASKAQLKYADPNIKTAPPVPVGESGPPYFRVAMKWHWMVIGVLAVACFLSYRNSFQSGWVLDNLYIIKYDPRSKAVEWNDASNQPGVKQIFIQDYWWPKGISGLFRPITTLSYWANWSLERDGVNTGLKILDAPINCLLHLINMTVADGKTPEGKISLATIPPDKQGDPRYVEAKVDVPTDGFHWVNLFIHVGNAILVYMLMLRLTARFWVAVATALIFATHPIATESVTNIIGRADLLAATTVLAGLLAYIRSTQAVGWRKIVWLLVVSLITLVGVFCKESAIAVAPVIVLYDITYRYTREELRELIPSFLVVAILGALACVVTIGLVATKKMFPFHTQMWMVISVLFLLISAFFVALLMYALVRWVGKGPPLGTTWRNPLLRYAVPWLFLIPPIAFMFWARGMVFWYSTPAEEPFLDNPIRYFAWDESLGAFTNINHWIMGRLTACKIAGRLLYLLVCPVTLSSDYSYDQIPLFGWDLTRWSNVEAILAFLVLVALLVFAIYHFKHNKAIFFFIFLYFINYLPTSNFLYNIGSIMAERFMYLPLIAFAAIVVITVNAIARRAVKPLDAVADAQPSRPALAHILLAVLCILYGIRAFERNKDWKSDLTLWTSAKKHSPSSFRSYQSYAFAVYEQVVKPPNERSEEGKNAAIEEAIHADEEGFKIVDPLPDALNSSRLYLHLGMYYSMKGESVNKNAPNQTISQEGVPWLRKAIEVLERAVPIDRAFNEVNRQRDLRRGKPPSETADVGLAPVYVYLGMAYSRVGLFEQALEAYKYARHLEPNDSELYFKIALVQIARGQLASAQGQPDVAAARYDDAAVALIQSVMLDPNRSEVWKLLIELYRNANSDGQPPLTPTPDGKAQLNLANRGVRENFCAAYRDFIRIFLRAKRDDMARSARDAAVNQYKYSPALFDPLFNEQVVPERPPAPVVYKPTTRPAPDLPGM